jgi:hypothetical protein
MAALDILLGILLGSGLCLLGRWDLSMVSRRRKRRTLASALIGEIVAILDTIEAQGVVVQLDKCATAEETFASRQPVLPAFAIFNGNAGRLECFDAPLPRKIAYFYTRLAALCGSLEGINAMPAGAFGNDLRTQRAQVLATEFRTILDLADDILRQLRLLLPQRRLHFRLHRQQISTAPVYRRYLRRSLRHPFARRSSSPPAARMRAEIGGQPDLW